MSTRSFGKVGKTYRSADEAFRGAEYATSIYKCNTDYERTIVLFKDLLPILLFILFMFASIFAVFGDLLDHF